MATLMTQKFIFEPDMNIIREQCDWAVKRNPSFKKQITAALRDFQDARRYVSLGDVRKSFEKLEKTMHGVLDVGVDELEASCSCYMGFLALVVGSDEPDMVKTGLDLLDIALHKTQNPLLALNTYNRLMIHHLSNENFDAVMDLASTTQKMLSRLPRSEAIVYFDAGASYNIAEAFFRQDKYSEAISHVQEALKGFRELAMKAETAKCQGLLGNSLILIGKTKEGLEDTEKSLELFRRMKNDGEVAFLLYGRALAMIKMDNKASAIQDLREALNLFKRLGEIDAVNSTLALLADFESQ